MRIARLKRLFRSRLKLHTVFIQMTKVRKRSVHLGSSSFCLRADGRRGRRQDLEKIIRFMRKICAFCSLSVCLYLAVALLLSHTRTRTLSLDSAKTPKGESFWLLEMSNCFVMSNLSQAAQLCRVFDVSMCVSQGLERGPPGPLILPLKSLREVESIHKKACLCV